MIIRTFFTLLFAVLAVLPVAAQDFAEDVVVEITPIAAGREAVQAGKAAIFSAERSRIRDTEEPVSYAWTFGDGTRATGVEAAHIYTQPGEYEITLAVQQGADREETRFPVFVYRRSVLMITDRVLPDTQLDALAAVTREHGIFFSPASTASPQAGFAATESAVAAVLRSTLVGIPEADTIFVWMRTGDGFAGLVRFAQQNQDALASRRVVLITDAQLESHARLAAHAFSALGADSILVTRSDALRVVLLGGVTPAVLTALDEQLIAYRHVLSSPPVFSPLFPLSSAVEYLLVQGIPASVLLLILMLPVITMIIAFLKQVVGITTFGVYLPSVLTLSFLTIGLTLGLLTLVVVIAASVVVRTVLRRYRLSYTPRMAIVLASVALAVLLAIVAIAWLAPIVELATPELLAASIFPMLIMSTLAERFVSIQTEQGSRSAFILLLEVMATAVVAYLIVGGWDAFRTLMLARPEWSLAFILGSILLGRYTGLRVSEYIRFRDVIARRESEE